MKIPIQVEPNAGAASAVEYAARHPDRVSHLVLYGVPNAGPLSDAGYRVILMDCPGWSKSDWLVLPLFGKSHAAPA